LFSDICIVPIEIVQEADVKWLFCGV